MEIEARLRVWDAIVAYAKESVNRPAGVAAGEERRRKKLQERMRLYEQQLAELPRTQQLALSSLFCEKILLQLVDLHAAVVMLNGQHRSRQHATVEGRDAANERLRKEFAEIQELYEF